MFMFSLKKNGMKGCSVVNGNVLYWKADIPEVSVKRKCFVGNPEMLSESLLFDSWQPC